MSDEQPAPRRLRARDKEVAEIGALLDRHELLVRLVVANTTEVMANITDARQRLATATRAQLRNLRTEVERSHRDASRFYGFRIDDKDIVGMLTKARASCADRPMMIPKWLLVGMFSNYAAAVSEFDTLPMHTRIMLDSRGEADGRPSVELWTLEVSMFEDMAAIFNLGHRMGEPSDKEGVKAARAIRHGCVTAAYYFIESYMNGIAVDCLHSRGTSLTGEERDQLLEWDSARDRARPLTMRAKILRYSRIAAQLPHPPIQENNCPELAFLLQGAKSWRDAIVHSSAMGNLATGGPEKERMLLELEWVDVERTVDSVVSLVRRIHAACKLPVVQIRWLIDRDATGLFPARAFA
jgi:hypothetical protein